MFAYVILRKSKLLVITYFNFSDLPLFGKKCSFELVVDLNGLCYWAKRRHKTPIKIANYKSLVFRGRSITKYQS